MADGQKAVKRTKAKLAGEGGYVRPPRAPYATDPAKSRGRLHPEPESRNRNPFERDRDRIVHSSAFRRLRGKTQVFVAHEGDHYRTRLSHSLEVAQIARTVARQMGLDDDLAETLGIAHDLGHPPFGHTGEDVLDAAMEGYAGFDHNAQTLRVLTKLERRYPTFDGLNLTWETLEGVVKHNGPLIRYGATLQDLPIAIQEYVATHDLELESWPGPEAQVAAFSDDIAYNNHDIDDGLRAGLFTLAEIRADVPMVERVLVTVERDYPDIDEFRTSAEMVRRLIGVLVDDLVWESTNRLNDLKPQTPEDIRAAGKPLVGFSDVMNEHQSVLRRFLMQRMYRHWKVNRSRSHAKRILRELFDLFLGEPELLPPAWQEGGDGPRGQRTARRVCDYIAGMTDDYAIEEHRRLFTLER
ncbi:Deoxyguanosinetriphosphate triphosphohydrolase [Terricaulis silvestris]|uniref:Deoxyguanosinetriphosphate triphosphohydrolase-like protein n=1 Tax=Terricaulis silvestris TaxID=2686094 RepID=A0A6I6MLB7_9CAUL|nr:Deoxyguanosinetriphosphate triphosphohydrolase [Terricaulis silvestris]